MKRMFLSVVLACGVLWGATVPVTAEIYVYRDRRGTLHFSNAPTSSRYRHFVPGHRSKKLRPLTASQKVRRKAFDKIIAECAKRYSVDPALVKAVIHVESNFFPYARSPKGALGLMQLMPETARRYGAWQGIFDPKENVDAGVNHLRRLLDRYGGDVRLALAAYNAGEHAVSRYGGVPPYPETREYLERVLYYRLQYLHE